MIKSSSIYIAQLFFILLNAIYCADATADNGFSWPISCVPGVDCVGRHFRIGYPDVAGTGLSFACGKPGYTGHQGTDIVVSSVDQGVLALAAEDGIVKWTKDGLFDRCPNDSEHECDEREKSALSIGNAKGATLGFNAGNFVVIEHKIEDTRYLTLYAHLRKGSLKVAPGDKVSRSQQLGVVGSSGNSQIPHLHFGVYKEEGGMYRPVDPWKGACNTSSDGLWASAVPYRTDELLLAHPDGNIVNDSEIYLQTIQRSRPKNVIY
ncbi:MAG: peptidoglycan DD-metalloendopeptidase family protein [Geobacter sp.]|nr:peptidoglycan DD-metalloendopeptidase family protein [Geobacter sp.]